MKQPYETIPQMRYLTEAQKTLIQYDAKNDTVKMYYADELTACIYYNKVCNKVVLEWQERIPSKSFEEKAWTEWAIMKEKYEQ